MLFVDDLVLCDESRDDMKEGLEDCRKRLENISLKVSRSKTEYLLPKKSSDNISLKKSMIAAHMPYLKEPGSKYLGTTIHQERGCKCALAKPEINEDS